MVKANPSKKISAASPVSAKFEEALNLGYLLSEKCELKKAAESFEIALKHAKKAEDLRLTMLALSSLLRLAGDANDREKVERLEKDLDRMIKSYPDQVPAMAWYCKGAIARFNNEAMLAQRYFHRYLRAIRRESATREDLIAKAWVMLATCLMQRKRIGRSRRLAMQILRRYENKNFPSINGTLYQLLGAISERVREYEIALRWYQKAHGAFLGEHNWYAHLRVLYAYARVARKQRNYVSAYWYLDLLDKATQAPEFAQFRHDILSERSRLEQDAVDLLIDSRKGLVKTREQGGVSLRKQYVLLDILEALSEAHRESSEKGEEPYGLSKAEIIQKVWRENYRPEAHDNKLYYNINRLRKLIEPDMRQPQYLLNWKEGYRLAPGLRIHVIGGKLQKEKRGEEE